MTPRHSSNGIVFQRKRDGRWIARLTIAGKRHERCGHTQREAELLLEAMRQEPVDTRSTTGMPDPVLKEPGPELDDWVDRWLARMAQDHRPSTIDIYRRSLAALLEYLPNARLDTSLTPLSLDSAFSKLAEAGVGIRFRSNAYAALRVRLNRAVDLELIGVNPLLKVAKPKLAKRKRSYWTPEQVQRVIAVAAREERRWDGLFVVLLTTGMRVSEALGLRWSDIDLDQRWLQVERAFVWSGKSGSIQEPKTEAGNRRISLPELAVLALSRQPRDSTDVFRCVNGSVPSHTNLRRSLLRLCEAAGVPPINPHGLRHVHAMLALDAGIDPYALQRRLGHSHVNVTLGIYGYSLTKDADVSRVFDQLMDG